MEDFVLKEAKQGNEFAFARIVETYEKRIYQLCYRMVGTPEDAADQTQETFLKAWRGLSAFQGDCSIGTWLYRLAANCCIDHLLCHLQLLLVGCKNRYHSVLGNVNF